MDCLKPGDVVILATPPAFRWVHFRYAIDKGLNVFMEKPVSVDGPTTRRMIALGEEAGQQEPEGGGGFDGAALPRAAGAAKPRSATGRSATSSRCAATAWGRAAARRRSKPEGITRTDVPDQTVPLVSVGQRRRLQRLLHSPDRRAVVDEGRVAGGGDGDRRTSLSRRFGGPELRRLLGAVHVSGWHAPVLRWPQHAGVHNEFASYMHGSKGSAVVSTNAHTPGRTRIYKGRTCRGGRPARKNRRPENLVWAFPQPERSPYDWEWDDLIAAIRDNKPYNEVQARRGSQPGGVVWAACRRTPARS